MAFNRVPTMILFLSSLFGVAFGSDVKLEAGQAFIFATPGYPNVEETAGTLSYDFQSSLGSKIFGYCEDYRTIGDRDSPCEAFELIFDDGVTKKKLCYDSHYTDAYFQSSSNRLKVRMSFTTAQYVYCVARSTEPTRPETIILSSSNPTARIMYSREPQPYNDQTWIVKSANFEKFDVECKIYGIESALCHRERYEITTGPEHKVICTEEEFNRKSVDQLTLRAVYGKTGYGSQFCEVRIPDAPVVTTPRPTRAPPTQFSENVFLNAEQIHHFESAGYPYGEASANSVTTINFETSPGAKIEVYCEDFRMRGTDPNCDEYLVSFDDGVNVDKICGTSHRVYRASSTNKFSLTLKFTYSVAIKCLARTTAEPTATKAHVEVNNVPFIFERAYEAAPEPYKHSVYKLTTEPGARISLQCSITFSTFETCSENLFEVHDGTNVETYCKPQHLVVFATGTSLKIRVQLGRNGNEYYRCVVQAVTGSHPDQHQNVQSEEIDSTERGSRPGKVRTTCDCGRRFWPNKTQGARVYNGKITRESEYTWMVGIRDHDNFQRCGGSLITEYHVLTAAHCMVSHYTRKKDEIWDTVVAIGVHDRTMSQNDSALHGETQFIEVLEKNVYIPEEWWTFKKHFDISVIVMEKPAVFGIHVGPVCIAKRSPKLWNKEIRVTGWGRTETNAASVLLKETNLVVVASEICGMDPWIMCTLKNNTGTCSGDSGSPLVYYDDDTNRYVQVSLVSFGYTVRCTPGVGGHTNVTYLYDWVESKVKSTKPNSNLCTKVE